MSELSRRAQPIVSGKGTPVIEAVNLTKRYGDKTAVDDVTFQVMPGTVTGFLGPNGAGKSTTMRMIVGLPGEPRFAAPWESLRRPSCTSDCAPRGG